MASYPSRGRKRPARSNPAANPNLSDELLLATCRKLEANATGLPVGDQRPDFYGMPLAAAKAAASLKLYQAEAHKRGLL